MRPTPKPSAAPALLGTLLLLALLPTLAAAQARPPADQIASDRPGLGDGSHVLAPGVWQLELGGTIEKAGFDEFATGTALIRWGLAPLELRFFVPTLAVARGEEETELGDLGVGAKLPLASSDGWTWSLGGAVTFPTGSESYTADDATGSAALLADGSLSPEVALGVNLGYGFGFDDAGSGTLSVIVTPSFAVTQSVNGYAGYAGFLSEGADRHFLEAGLTTLADDDTQWDLNGGFDLESDAWFIGIGLAHRWR